MPAGTDTKLGGSATTHDPIIVDIGKRRRKQIRSLRRGEGKLMTRMNDLLGEMKKNGTLSGSAQPVIVVVQQKRRRNKGWRW